MKLTMYWNYATRSLIRSGQRTILGIFCIAVGVMAIVALQLVGISVNQSLTSNIAEANGGDLRVATTAVALQPKDLAIFDAQQNAGNLTAYATTENLGGSVTLSDGTAVPFDVEAISSNFPLVGNANFTQPNRGVTIQQIVQGNQVAIVQQLADSLHAKVGDTFTVTTEDLRQLQVTIGGIYQTGGQFTGTTMLVTEQTLDAATLPNGNTVPPKYTTITINAPADKIASLQTTLQNALPSATVQSVNDLLKQRQNQVALLRLFLQIVGLLAIFIGGIGIVNTIQVLLRRRQVEIAMLKTAGYRQGDLYALFGLETALLGLIGGVLGAATGVGVSGIVRVVMQRTFFLTLPAVYDWKTIIAGVFIGFSTSLIFGLLPIVEASQIRPLAVLRGVSEEGERSSRGLTAILLVLLSLLFVGLTTSIVGNLLEAALITYGGALIILALAVGFGLLVLAISRLPVYEVPSSRMLLWILLGFGILVGGALAGLLMIGIGSAATFILVRIGQGAIGSYIATVLGGFGLVIIGGAGVYFIATLLDALIMFLPRGAKTAVMLAFRNIGRQRLRTTTTLTALFVGVFAIGLIVILGQGIKDAINNVLNTFLVRNVFVATTPAHIADVETILAQQGKAVDTSKTTSNLLAADAIVTINGQSINTVLLNDPLKGFRDNSNIGRQGIEILLSSMQGYDLQGGATNPSLLPEVTLSSKKNAGRILTTNDAGTNNIMLSDQLMMPPLNLQAGDTIVVSNLTSDPTKASLVTLTIVGFYNSNSASSFTFGSILADNGLVQTIGGAQLTAIVSGKIDPTIVPQLRKNLQTAVPGASLFSVADVSAAINGILDNLILLLTTISSLAMVAGLIIIANAVALAMLERRREIGILKSVGHTSGSILATVLVENGLVGFVGALVAMLLVGSAITLLSVVSGTQLGLAVPLVFLVIGSTVVVTMSIAALVAWSATRLRPVEVLRYE